jgi:hypothetical protein
VDVLGERRELVGHDVEALPGHVDAGGGGDALVQLLLAAGRHRAPGVWDHQDPLDPEQMDAEDERLERGVGDPSARVAEDLGVSVPQSEHCQGHDP